MDWPVKEGYTFGMPRTGDAIFAVNFDHVHKPQDGLFYSLKKFDSS